MHDPEPVKKSKEREKVRIHYQDANSDANYMPSSRTFIGMFEICGGETYYLKTNRLSLYLGTYSTYLPTFGYLGTKIRTRW